GQVEQHAGQHGVAISGRHRAADDVRGVFLVGQPARALRGRAAGREHEYARTLRRRAGPGVGVDGQEDVGTGGAGLARTLVERNEVVGIAGEVGLHARRGVDLARQFLGDGQGHVLLAGAAGATRTGVLATVAGVDGDD